MRGLGELAARKMWPSVHNFVSRCYASFMVARLGVLIYIVGIGAAVLMVVLGVVIVLFSNEPLLSIAFFFFAVVAWGIGRAALYVLAGE